MHILLSIQGQYGRRKVDNMRKRSPSGWHLDVVELPLHLPTIIDEPDDFLPPSIPRADLLIHLGEIPQAAQLIPALAHRSQARSIIAPVDNSAWFPAGLQNQLLRELAANGITMICPKPFCSLTEDSYGYGTSARPHCDPVIATFARHFGRPEFKLTLDATDGHIRSLEVVRSTPCGSDYYAVERLAGSPATELVPQSGLYQCQYPCLGAMVAEQLDDFTHDTIMHAAGFLSNQAMERALHRANTAPVE